MTVDTTDIKKSLTYLDLSETEIDVYLTLLSHRVLSLSEISKITDIPRTTVYRLAEALVKKKLAEWVVYQRGKKLRAIATSKLERKIKEAENDLEKIKEAIDNIQNYSKNIITNLPLTQLRYYKGKEGMKQLIWNTLDAKEEIVGYSVYGRTKVVGKKFIQNYVDTFRTKKLIDRVLINKKSLKEVRAALSSKHQQTKENVRLIDKKDFYISGDTYIYNNIYAVNFWNKKEIVGIEIENPEISKVQKSIFKSLWQKAKPIQLTTTCPS